MNSIDLSDIEDKEQGEIERKEYCATISAVFPRLEKDIKKFLYEQLYFMANESADWDGVIFGRGTFNGLKILLDHWEAAHLEHQGRKVEEKPEDENNPIGEI